MRAVGIEEGTEREEDAGHGGGAAVSRQPPSEEPRTEKRRGEREEHRTVVRSVRITRDEPCRDRHDAGNNVGFGICERAAMRVKDVRIEERRRAVTRACATHATFQMP